MNNDDLLLLHRYLDGAITPHELERLEDLLSTNAEARATLRSLATIDAKWQQLAAEESLAGEPMRNRGLDLSDHQQGISLAQSSSYVDLRQPRFWVPLSAVAASLIFAVFVWHLASEERSAQIQGIARVIQVEGEGKVGQDRLVTDGAELFAGEELTMSQGLIELAFRETGVHVIATAPLKLTLNSDQRVSLHDGQVKLVVPPQGVGFVVDTIHQTFVDLGTSFVVTVNANVSEVLVLDGQILVDDHAGTSADLMHEGEFAKFDREGRLEKRSPSRISQALPELTLPATKPGGRSLHGVVLGYDSSTTITKAILREDVIGREMLPLIQTGFQDRASLDVFKQGEPLRFGGIAGAFHRFPERTGLTPFSRKGGWMAWYQGEVRPPLPGRYRFWGYADNHLLIAIDGKPVFEGSRIESTFTQLGIRRTNNPALPCLIAPAGFACSDWIELSGDPVQIDLLFGEVGGFLTSGLLLVEREGETYEETIWGQRKWPLFLTEAPGAEETAEFERLVDHLEQRTMGSFSISADAIWQVQN